MFLHTQFFILNVVVYSWLIKLIYRRCCILNGSSKKVSWDLANKDKILVWTVEGVKLSLMTFAHRCAGYIFYVQHLLA
jgi:hypothetical protein